MAYGVSTTNVFDLLGESEDGEDPTPVVTAVEAKKKDAPSKTAETAKPAAAAPKPVAAGVEARLRGQGPPDGGRGRGPPRGRGSPRGRGGRGEDRPPREDTAVDAGETSNGPTNRGRGGRIGGRGAGRGRGRDGDFQGRHRQFDRHDASGRGYETEKRHGAGKGNWGAEGDDVNEPERTTAATPDEGAPTPEEEPVPAAEAAEPEKDVTAEAEPEPETPKEDEKPEMTLEEYEALIAEKRSQFRKQPTKPTSNADQDFKGMKAFERKNTEDDNDLELQNKKIVGGRKAGTVEKGRKEKETVETGFRVVDDTSSPKPFGGRGRGGRGRGDFGRGDYGDRDGGRGERGPPRDRDDRSNYNDRPNYNGRGRGPRPEGGRGRGGGRNGPTPNFDDAAAFPTLGGN